MRGAGDETTASPQVHHYGRGLAEFRGEHGAVPRGRRDGGSAQAAVRGVGGGVGRPGDGCRQRGNRHPGLVHPHVSQRAGCHGARVATPAPGK